MDIIEGVDIDKQFNYSIGLLFLFQSLAFLLKFWYYIYNSLLINNLSYMSKLYGVNSSQKVTPLIVRDALINCFYKAHCEDTGIDAKEESTNKEYCKAIISKAFDDVGDDFENPTKEGILNVVSKLKDFSKSFRNPKIIEKHSKEILALIKKLG